MTHYSQRHKGLFEHAGTGKRVIMVYIHNGESGIVGVVSSIPMAFPITICHIPAFSMPSVLIAH